MFLKDFSFVPIRQEVDYAINDIKQKSGRQDDKSLLTDIVGEPSPE